MKRFEPIRMRLLAEGLSEEASPVTSPEESPLHKPVKDVVKNAGLSLEDLDLLPTKDVRASSAGAGTSGRSVLLLQAARFEAK